MIGFAAPLFWGVMLFTLPLIAIHFINRHSGRVRLVGSIALMRSAASFLPRWNRFTERWRFLWRAFAILLFALLLSEPFWETAFKPGKRIVALDPSLFIELAERDKTVFWQCIDDAKAKGSEFYWLTPSLDRWDPPEKETRENGLPFVKQLPKEFLTGVENTGIEQLAELSEKLTPSEIVVMMTRNGALDPISDAIKEGRCDSILFFNAGDLIALAGAYFLTADSIALSLFIRQNGNGFSRTAALSIPDLVNTSTVKGQRMLRLQLPDRRSITVRMVFQNRDQSIEVTLVEVKEIEAKAVGDEPFLSELNFDPRPIRCALPAPIQIGINYAPQRRDEIAPIKALLQAALGDRPLIWDSLEIHDGQRPKVYPLTILLLSEANATPVFDESRCRLMLQSLTSSQPVIAHLHNGMNIPVSGSKATGEHRLFYPMTKGTKGEWIHSVALYPNEGYGYPKILMHHDMRIGEIKDDYRVSNDFGGLLGDVLRREWYRDEEAMRWRFSTDRVQEKRSQSAFTETLTEQIHVLKPTAATMQHALSHARDEGLRGLIWIALLVILILERGYSVMILQGRKIERP